MKRILTILIGTLGLIGFTSVLADTTSCKSQAKSFEKNVLRCFYARDGGTDATTCASVKYKGKKGNTCWAVCHRHGKAPACMSWNNKDKGPAVTCYHGDACLSVRTSNKNYA